jgi:hypothetical protein
LHGIAHHGFWHKALAKDSILLVLICTGRDHAKFRRSGRFEYVFFFLLKNTFSNQISFPRANMRRELLAALAAAGVCALIAAVAIQERAGRSPAALLAVGGKQALYGYYPYPSAYPYGGLLLRAD